jgi:hypothetical protein
MSRNAVAALAFALFTILAVAPAHAVLITVNFTVAGAANDPVNAGTTASGSFSFDSSIIPPAGGTLLSPVTSGFNFTWDGTSWTDATASCLEIEFDAAGNLTRWYMYGDPSDSFMITFPDPVDDFQMSASSSGSEFRYVREGAELTYRSTLTYTIDTGSAPEPTPWMLAGVGLLAMMSTASRHRRA